MITNCKAFARISQNQKTRMYTLKVALASRINVNDRKDDDTLKFPRECDFQSSQYTKLADCERAFIVAMYNLDTNNIVFDEFEKIVLQ